MKMRRLNPGLKSKKKRIHRLSKYAGKGYAVGYESLSGQPCVTIVDDNIDKIPVELKKMIQGQIPLVEEHQNNFDGIGWYLAKFGYIHFRYKGINYHLPYKTVHCEDACYFEVEMEDYMIDDLIDVGTEEVYCCVEMD